MKVSEEQIKDWKEQYGSVFMLPVDDKVAYLRAPKMLDFKRAFSALTDDGDIAFSEEMLNALWLDGDKEILNDDEYFSPARKTLKKLLEFDDAIILPLKNNTSQINIGEYSCLVRVITREDIRTAERKNPNQKPFVTQEKLFNAICIKKDKVFDDKNNPEIRFPLYKAIEDLQNKKIARLKKL